MRGYDLDLWYFRWFEKQLKGTNCIPAETPAVEYFTVGQDTWKNSCKWPPESTEKTTLYLAADGMLDVKYREGFDHAVFMEPGQVYHAQIRTSKFSACFRKGERLRFTVTSSAVNFSFPNSNTKDGFNSLTYRVAANSVHYGCSYPSCIELFAEK